VNEVKKKILDEIMFDLGFLPCKEAFNPYCCECCHLNNKDVLETALDKYAAIVLQEYRDKLNDEGLGEDVSYDPKFMAQALRLIEETKDNLNCTNLSE